MNMSNREKFLLIVLSLLILLIVYYQFLLSPRLKMVSELKAEVEAYKNEKQKIDIITMPNNKVHGEYSALSTKILHSSTELFPEIIQEKIISIIDTFIKDSNIDIFSIGFGEEEVASIEMPDRINDNANVYLDTLVKEFHNQPKSEEKEQKKVADTETKENNFNGDIKKMYSSIDFRGSYNEILSLVHEIESYDKRIIIKSLTITKPEDSELAAKIDLDFYAIPKLHDSEDNYLIWDISNSYGKDNPFNAYSSYSGMGNFDGIFNTYNKSYDFIMTVKSITSDLPTVILGKTNDDEMETYVYGDNPGFEDVEFIVIKKEGKYYFKYKTQNESYPKDYSDKVEFNPTGENIELNIISHSRNDLNDTDGVNLTIINETDMTVHVTVDYDDDKRPRVSIIKKVGDIEVKK